MKFVGEKSILWPFFAAILRVATGENTSYTLLKLHHLFLPPFVFFDFSRVQLCVALNSTEHVRVFLSRLPRDLDWPGVERAMEESCGAEGKEQVYKALNGQLFNMDLDLQREAKRLIALLTDKVRHTHTHRDTRV